MKCLLVNQGLDEREREREREREKKNKNAESPQWLFEEDNPQRATGTGSICVDVALISSLGAGCYDCPVMRAVAAARHAGRGQGGAVAIEAHKV